MTQTRTSTRYVLAFFAFLFVLLSSGRLGSSDAGGQLAAATLLATEHRLGTAPSPGTPGWVPAPNGKVYEAHDLGALVLMTPNAWLASKLTHATHAEQFRSPPLLAKVGTSLTYAVVCAIGCTYLFMFFASFYPVRSSFLLALAFALGTFFVAYAKQAWDVAPASAMMCVTLYSLARIQREDAGWRAFMGAGVALAMLCSFRYSLAPFMAVTLAYLALPRPSRWPHYAALAVSFLVCMIPTFIYNYVRMGSPLRPATTSTFYLNGNNSLDGNMVDGVLGLLYSGNHGLLFYAPILVLCFGLPLAWQSMPTALRKLVVATALGSLLYFLLISKMVNWGTFGWGARYLLPVLPVWFIAAAAVLMEVASKSRVAAIAVGALTIALNLAPILTNWNVVAAEYPGAQDPVNPVPSSIVGLWTGMEQGLHGRPMQFETTDPAAVASDPARRFPDLWTAQLAQTSSKGRIAGLGIALALLLGTAWSVRRLWTGPRFISAPVSASTLSNAERERLGVDKREALPML